MILDPKKNLHNRDFFPKIFDNSNNFNPDLSLLTKKLFKDYHYPWQLLYYLKQELTDYIDKNSDYINVNKKKSNIASTAIIDNDVFIEDNVTIEDYAVVKGPAYLASKSKLRAFSYIRGGVILEKNSLVGHATEVKDSILLCGAKAAHQSYVGNSILGCNVNLGAGTKTANVRFDKKQVKIKIYSKINKNFQVIDTNLKKFGTIFGDNSQTGCLVVTNPGTLIYPQKSLIAKKVVSGIIK